jgi:transcriptional regulator with XRE-family HTH domain
VTQVALARRAGVPLSLLSKIEVGDRTLTPAIAAAIARALQISLGAQYEEAEVSPEQSTLLKDPRTAVHRYDIPDQAPVPDRGQLRIDLEKAVAWWLGIVSLMLLPHQQRNAERHAGTAHGTHGHRPASDNGSPAPCQDCGHKSPSPT